MKNLRPRKAVTGPLILIGLLALCFCVVRFGGAWLQELQARELKLRSKIARTLQGRGVAAYWSFDDVYVADDISLAPCSMQGAERVPGRFGHARRFEPGRLCNISTALPLGDLGRKLTISCWMKFPPAPANQSPLPCHEVRDGRLEVSLSKGSAISWPISIHERFFHWAVVADADAGLTRAYVNGNQVGEVALTNVNAALPVMEFGERHWNPPCNVVLDECTLWNRPLDQSEVRAMGRMRTSMAWHYRPRRRLELELVRLLRNGLRAVLRTADLSNPFRSESAIAAAGILSTTLSLSKADLQAFNQYVNFHTRNGLTETDGQSERRRVVIADADGESEATMRLVSDSPDIPPQGSRMSFLIDAPSSEPGVRRRMLFRPIELKEFMIDLTAADLAARASYPAIVPELHAVRVNGRFEGIYLRRNLNESQRLTWNGNPRPWREWLSRAPFSRGEILDAFDKCFARYKAAILADRRFPLTSGELASEIARQRQMLADSLDARKEVSTIDMVEAYVDERLFLGGNPEPRLIVQDLDFSPGTVNGVALSFISQNPGVVGNDGKISPPAESPAAVIVELTMKAGTDERRKQLHYTVLPAGRRLPVLRVESLDQIGPGGNVQCLAEYLEEGVPQGDVVRGHIRWRGNTALVKAIKKYYLMELDDPLELGELPQTRHLLLTSCYRDPTFMRDKLSYDVFRSFSEPGKPRLVPRAQYVELVLNHEYMGIYYVANRVDAELLHFPEPGPGERRPPVLYKGVGRKATFSAPVPAEYAQKLPSWRTGPHWDPFTELMLFIGSADAATFAAEVEKRIDLDNIIDFEILLLLTNNMEGRNANLYLARGGGRNSRFFIVPWDYDMTFRGREISNNFLINRLHRDLPGYSARVKARWSALRKDRLAEATLLGRMDDMEAILREGMERENARWPLKPGASHGKYVEFLRQWTCKRLTAMDAFVARMTPETAVEPPVEPGVDAEEPEPALE